LRVARIIAKTISELEQRSLALHSRAETLGVPVFIEERPAWIAGALMRASARGRRWAAQGVVCLVLVLAAGIGAAVGSRAFTAEARYHSALTAAQSGQVELYGPAEVPGHPGAQARQRQDFLRKILALDAVN
jgi:hypothetical protein